MDWSFPFAKFFLFNGKPQASATASLLAQENLKPAGGISLPVCVSHRLLKHVDL
jgi:hypothetical protein